MATDLTDRSLEPAGTDQYAAFEGWVRQHATPDAVLLDVGAGDGDQPYPTNLAPSVSRIVGVDPDEGVLGNKRIDEAVHAPFEEFAAGHREQFDLAVAVYVVEHVADPVAFATALHGCLRPGGSAFILTPNRWHYFGLATSAASRLHVEEPILRLVRDRPTVEEYHVPTEYRLNTIRCVRRHLAAAGFSSVEVATYEQPSMYDPYLPTAVRGLASGWHALAYRSGRPNLMGHLMIRAVR